MATSGDGGGDVATATWRRGDGDVISDVIGDVIGLFLHVTPEGCDRSPTAAKSPPERSNVPLLHKLLSNPRMYKMEWKRIVVSTLYHVIFSRRQHITAYNPF